jgi:1-acyl-sn-glycerol-3-phosphate acyltransferase
MNLRRPHNDCGVDCLPAAERPAAPPLVRLGRLLALAGVVVAGAVWLPFAPRSAAFWARAMLRAIGVRVSVGGRIPHRRALLVANHVSWLDIVAILAVAPSRIVAKHEVRRWPLVGAMAVAAGTIFVDRSRPRTLPATVGEVAAALRTDRTVAVFPEGTTGCGEAVGPFRPAMFQAAIDAGAVVVPLTLRYDQAAAAFVGDDSLYASLRRILALRHLTVSVTASPALYPGDAATRRRLATVARMAVSASRLPPERLGLAA